MLRRRTTSFDAGFLILFNCFAYPFLFVASFFVHFVIHQFLITPPTTSDFVFFLLIWICLNRVFNNRCFIRATLFDLLVLWLIS